MAFVAEFIVEPFVPGQPGPHVVAALAAAEAAGATIEVGPFGTLVGGSSNEVVLRAAELAVRAALANGATRVSVQFEVRADDL